LLDYNLVPLQPESSVIGEPVRSKSILLVDDDQYLLDTLARFMRRAGYEVAPFCQFDAAKTFLSQNTPDVLITDIRLGAFNGLQLIVALKERDPNATAIVLTGFDDAVMRAQAWSLGASYLVKPITFDEVLQTIDEGELDSAESVPGPSDRDEPA